MTIFISGANGFLGSNLVKFFIDNGHEVIVLIRKTSNLYRINQYLERCTVYTLEEVDFDIIFKKHKVDVVINTVTNYGRNSDSASSVIDANLLLGLKLLENSIDNSVKLFINTDTILDKNLNAYTLSKKQLVEWMLFLSNSRTKIVNIKIEHMYGPFDDENKFIYWLISQLKMNVNTINLTTGIQKRDFIYIDDIVSAYDIIIKHMGNLPNYEEFELGTENSREIKYFIDIIYTKLLNDYRIDTKLNFGAIPYRKNENMNIQVDTSKIKSLGWKYKVEFNEGIKEVLKNDI